MRDPGPARSGPALLCSTRWLNTQPPNYREQSRAAGHLSLHPKPPSSLPLHSFLFTVQAKHSARAALRARNLSFLYLCRSRTHFKMTSFYSLFRSFPSFWPVHSGVCFLSRRGLDCLPVRSPFPQRHEVISCAALSFPR